MRHAGGVDGDADEPDEGDDERPAVDPSGSVRPITIALLIVAFLSIPVGLVLFYLALTRGEPSPRPAVGKGVVGIDSPVTPTDLEGQWSLLAGGASSVAYNAGATSLPGSTPITLTGRTPSVEAGFVVRDGKLQVTVAQADLRQVRDGASDRDSAMSVAALEVDAFPLARFRSDQPVDLPATIQPETAFPLTLDGELMLHGVTRPVQMHVTARVVWEEQLVIVLEGSATIRFRDFGIDPPATDTLRVGEDGQLELRLRLARRTTSVTIARDITTASNPTTATRPPGTTTEPVPTLAP